MWYIYRISLFGEEFLFVLFCNLDKFMLDGCGRYFCFECYLTKVISGLLASTFEVLFSFKNEFKDLIVLLECLLQR